MTTPIESLVANVNAQTQRDTLQSIAQQTSAVTQLADKTSAINAIVDNADQTAKENFFNGVVGDGQAESALASNNDVIDKVSEQVTLIELLNNSESAIRKLLCSREGRDPANFADLDAVAADQGLMQSIAARQESSKIAARSQKASAAIAVSQTAMIEIGDSATARAEVYASGTALSEIRPVDQAIAKLSAGQGGADPANFPDMSTLAADAIAMQGVAASQTAMQEVAASQTAMQGVANSQTAMREVRSSQTAMQEVAVSQTAMTEIDQVDFAVRAIMCGTTTLDPSNFANADDISQDAAAMSEIVGDAITMTTLAGSQTAMQEVAASSVAINAIEGASTSGTNTIPITDDASLYIATLEGAGGGGGDEGNIRQASQGGKTAFNESFAEGGTGGQRFTPGEDRGGGANPPDILLSSTTGGGALGGAAYQSDADGGRGGRVKALISNPNRESLFLRVGGGGSGVRRGEAGDDGSATILTPNAF